MVTAYSVTLCSVALLSDLYTFIDAVTDYSICQHRWHFMQTVARFEVELLLIKLPFAAGWRRQTDNQKMWRSFLMRPSLNLTHQVQVFALPAKLWIQTHINWVSNLFTGGNVSAHEPDVYLLLINNKCCLSIVLVGVMISSISESWFL